MRSTQASSKALDANAARKRNVLRGGHITEPAENEKGTWRYRVHTNTIWVVVAFRGETELVVVTVWRKR